MSDQQIHDGGSNGVPIYVGIDSTEPDNPIIRLECGCNEFWLDVDQAKAVQRYLDRQIPLMDRQIERNG